jgi:hypothetical protein
VRTNIDIIETVKLCINRPTQKCCSRALYSIVILLWYLVNSKINGIEWMTTRELCDNARFRNCNEARTYLYRLKKRGIVENSKIYTSETIWRINGEVLKKTDPRTLLRLFTLHYNMCTEYYKTGNLKKRVNEVKEDIEEEEFEEEAWEDIEEE